ncbi:hypothetical protein IU500_25895 [Nocardia terpenica]|uniref:hypothetical protein n=1 Tax=Nocardia terpenica TaxID=455432 RepID=UPI00189505A1|nr:hypothetical protein [Nocardia terpenica]MBF6061761.1 hypothetical protein [Nocardia terpenica]MBF6107444.1 hypothetical protein [Nocardia terpenica]MBF6110181.1 hypothetical protein [Nocardia terpenica]MBF6122307.1 hypothetical protein [Nocardia terpenica]MBF6151517.1 hypothetical protein [Nocardia terpenica]
MTRSDPDDRDAEHGNPFELGLPMVRLPHHRPPRRRRSMRRGGRRRPNPAVGVPEPLPDAEDSSDLSGDWEQWLDSGPRPPEPQQPPSETRAHLHVRDYGPADSEDTSLIPAIVDRSGGSPGPRLRHPRTTRRRERPNADKLIAVLIMLGVAVVVAAVVLTVIHTANRRTASAPPRTIQAPAPANPGASAAPTTAPTTPSTFATADCQTRRTPDVVSGTDPGGTASGPDAILAFERAYYVQRSGYAARAVVTDDATVPPADQIQRGINKIPPNTRYCVQITRTPTDNQWEVRLTQQQPDQQPATFTQLITTRTTADRTLITAIAPG